MGAGVSLTYRDDIHEYRFNGEVVPSVTKIISPLYDFTGISKEVLEAKAFLGSVVHKACELIDLGTMPDDWDAGIALPYVNAYRLFLHECKPEWHGIEERVFHPIHKYAGTLDRRGILCGGHAYADIKTSILVSAAGGVQTIAYLEAETEMRKVGKSAKRVVIHLKPDGTYRLEWFGDPRDWPTFLSCLTIYNWRKKHASN
jgi:hypothetical protein